jgi:hypothetical protein
MKISESSSVNKINNVGKKKNISAANGDFLGLLSINDIDNVAPPPPASDITSISSLDALLSLQEIPNDELSKQKAFQQSKEVIESLDNLRIALLSGTVSENILQKLKNLSNIKRQLINDNRLNNIIAEIELRAAVEIAKLEKSQLS